MHRSSILWLNEYSSNYSFGYMINLGVERERERTEESWWRDTDLKHPATWQATRPWTTDESFWHSRSRLPQAHRMWAVGHVEQQSHVYGVAAMTHWYTPSVRSGAHGRISQLQCASGFAPRRRHMMRTWCFVCCRTSPCFSRAPAHLAGRDRHVRDLARGTAVPRNGLALCLILPSFSLLLGPSLAYTTAKNADWLTEEANFSKILLRTVDIVPTKTFICKYQLKLFHRNERLPEDTAL